MKSKKKKLPQSVEVERIKIANERVLACLEKVGVSGEGYPVKFFELPFIGMKNKLGRVPSYRDRKRLLNKMLTGKAHPSMNAWIERLEEFCEIVSQLQRKNEGFSRIKKQGFSATQSKTE